MGKGSTGVAEASDNIDDTGGEADLEGEGSQGKGSQGGLQISLKTDQQ